MAFVPAGDSELRKRALFQNALIQDAQKQIQSGFSSLADIDREKRKQALLEQEIISRANMEEARRNEEFNREMRKEEREAQKFDYEKGVKEKELDFKEQELALKREEARKPKTLTPYQEELLNIKRGQGQGQAVIPGYESSSGLKLSSAEIDKLRTKEGSRKSIEDTAEELKAAFSQSGYFDRALPASRLNTKINSLITDLQLEAKEAANLGALTGPDLDLVNNLIGKFTGPIDALRGNQAAISAIDDVKNILSKKVRSQIEARGLTPINQPTQAPQQTPQMSRLEYLRAKKAGQI